MPETRILNEAEKLEEIEQSKDMQKTLLAIEKVMNREDISESEKKRLSIEIIDKKLEELKQAIELLAEHCNKGYGFRAVSTFLPAVSKLTGKNQYQALVEVDNLPSQRLMENLGARLIDIYDYAFHGDEEKAAAFEESHLDRITDRIIELANQIGVEPRKLLSHVLDYRFYVEDGKIVNMRR